MVRVGVRIRVRAGASSCRLSEVRVRARVGFRVRARAGASCCRLIRVRVGVRARARAGPGVRVGVRG